ncbi:MAG TPA: hypothetical protein VLA56_04710 [Pseudomonadales bacterium]|nr:hypothetical protein [Pseudomonadales bacterium]
MTPTRKRLAALASPRGIALGMLLMLGTGLAATGAEADLLPETPSAGLLITVTVNCDFEDRWWEATLHAGATVPLEFRTRTRRMFGGRERQSTVAIDGTTRAELYALARRAFEDFRIDRKPDFTGPGSDREWTGERTVTLAALVLDDELGRIDRVEMAIDVMRGRSLPPASLALVDAIGALEKDAGLEFECL